MEKIKVLIVDDEPRARRVLRTLLTQLHPELRIIGEAQNVLDAADKIIDLNPDIVFLDVQMPRHPGYELINFLKDINFEIIFCTAFDQYALKAFELCAVDYVLKPISKDKLSTAIKKAKEKLDFRFKLDHYNILLDTLSQKPSSKLIIPELGNRRIIETKNILAIEANGAYTIIHRLDGPVIMTSKNLKFYEEKLKPDNNFYRTHRSWIINIDKIVSFQKTHSVITMENQLQVKISRKHYAQFEKVINPDG